MNQGFGAHSDVLDASITTTASENPGAHRHAAKQCRLLVQKQTKQRSVLQAEELHEFADYTKMFEAELSAIIAFQRHRKQCEREHQRASYYDSLWSAWKTEESVLGLQEDESKERYQIVHQECEMRATFTRLQEMEGAPLLFKRALNMLIFAEKVRRTVLYRQELEEAMALNIPKFDPDIVSVEGISDKKLDWMDNIPCPFVFADDCPFFPIRVRETLSFSKDGRGSYAAAPNFKLLEHSLLNEEVKEKEEFSKNKSKKKKERKLFFSVPTHSYTNLDQNSGEKNAVTQEINSSIFSKRKKISSLSTKTSFGWADKLPGLSQASRIALKSTLSRGHYSRSECSFLPSLQNCSS